MRTSSCSFRRTASSNYPWLLRLGVRRGQRVGYWGHGRNLQSVAPDGLRERWKRWWGQSRRLVVRLHRFDARAILQSDGFPGERISVLNNAIDNDRFQRDLACVSPAQRAEYRARVGAGAADPVGLYCGSLYPDKRLDLLLAACERVRAEFEGFRLRGGG
ncbi:MAG: hypothetical protein U1F67_02050 [Rubrivivax sp.]